MAKFLVKASYTSEGTRGLLKEGGTSRKEMVEKMVAANGGRLEAFYFAFGEPDVFAIVDLPDAVTATAVSLAINASGAVSTSLTVLITPSEVDQASKRVVDYRAPGK